MTPLDEFHQETGRRIALLEIERDKFRRRNELLRGAIRSLTAEIATNPILMDNISLSVYDAALAVEEADADK